MCCCCFAPHPISPWGYQRILKLQTVGCRGVPVSALLDVLVVASANNVACEEVVLWRYWGKPVRVSEVGTCWNGLEALNGEKVRLEPEAAMRGGESRKSERSEEGLKILAVPYLDARLSGWYT